MRYKPSPQNFNHRHRRRTKRAARRSQYCNRTRGNCDVAETASVLLDTTRVLPLTLCRRTGAVYLITSLPAAATSPDRLPPARLLALNRAHWAIENKIHYVRDVSMDQDRCRVRAGAQALSGVRAALSIIRRSSLTILQARENYREDCADAIKAVTGRILRMAV